MSNIWTFNVKTYHESGYTDCCGLNLLYEFSRDYSSLQEEACVKKLVLSFEEAYEEIREHVEDVTEEDGSGLCMECNLTQYQSQQPVLKKALEEFGFVKVASWVNSRTNNTIHKFMYNPEGVTKVA